MTFTKLVVAGSTGTLASHVLPALQASTKPKFDITVLTRHDSQKHSTLTGVKLVPVDYDDHAALVAAVRGADAIVSLLNGVPAASIDQKLLKAAQEAGVRRIFISEYTLDALHPAAVKLFTELEWPQGFEHVVNRAQKFQALEREGGPTSYTALVPCGFIDMWLAGTYGIFNPKGHKVEILDDGDIPFTGTSLPFLAACIVAALQMDEEKTKNKRIHVAEVRTTTNEIISTYEELTGAKFETTTVTTQDVLAARDAAAKAGNWFAVWMSNIHLAAFDGSGAGDLQDGMKFDGDGLLTVPRKTLKEICAGALKMAGII